ncbi:hypothetical protein LINGRAHAP2_LOCUS34449, partial [Linum grandiflorum]
SDRVLQGQTHIVWTGSSPNPRWIRVSGLVAQWGLEFMRNPINILLAVTVYYSRRQTEKP